MASNGDPSTTDGSDAGRPPTEAGAKGHAPTTKVSLPAGVAARRQGDAEAPRPVRRRKAPPRPWYRQGRFWFAVIVAEVIVALVISVQASADDGDAPADPVAPSSTAVTPSTPVPSSTPVGPVTATTVAGVPGSTPVPRS